jgi:hypothetical protein
VGGAASHGCEDTASRGSRWRSIAGLGRGPPHAVRQLLPAGWMAAACPSGWWDPPVVAGSTGEVARSAHGGRIRPWWLDLRPLCPDPLVVAGYAGKASWRHRRGSGGGEAKSGEQQRQHVDWLCGPVDWLDRPIHQFFFSIGLTEAGI